MKKENNVIRLEPKRNFRDLFLLAIEDPDLFREYFMPYVQDSYPYPQPACIDHMIGRLIAYGENQSGPMRREQIRKLMDVHDVFMDLKIDDYYGPKRKFGRLVR